MNTFLTQTVSDLVTQYYPELAEHTIVADYKRMDCYTDYEPTAEGYTIMLDPSLQQANLIAIKGALADELTIITNREHTPRLLLHLNDLLENLFDKYAARIARKEDQLTIAKGLGNELLEYNKFLETTVTEYYHKPVDGMDSKAITLALYAKRT